MLERTTTSCPSIVLNSKREPASVRAGAKRAVKTLRLAMARRAESATGKQAGVDVWDEIVRRQTAEVKRAGREPNFVFVGRFPAHMRLRTPHIRR